MLEKCWKSGKHVYINREFAEFDFLKTFKDPDNLVKSYKKELKPSGKVYLIIG